VGRGTLDVLVLCRRPLSCTATVEGPESERVDRAVCFAPENVRLVQHFFTIVLDDLLSV
jgi:hypothetical protein